jgi:hypothetical protein
MRLIKTPGTGAEHGQTIGPLVLHPWSNGVASHIVSDKVNLGL